MDTTTILQRLKNGEISVEEAEKFFKRQPFDVFQSHDFEPYVKCTVKRSDYCTEYVFSKRNT